LAIGSIRDEKARALVGELVPRLDTMTQLHSLTYARGLLSLVFGNGERPFAKDFVTVLEAISQSRKFYGFVNCNDVLDDWNLPRPPAALAALAAEVKAEPDPEAAMHAKMHSD